MSEINSALWILIFLLFFWVEASAAAFLTHSMSLNVENNTKMQIFQLWWILYEWKNFSSVQLKAVRVYRKEPRKMSYAHPQIYFRLFYDACE